MNGPAQAPAGVPCPGWRQDGTFDPAACWSNPTDDDHRAETACRCTTWCGDPGKAGCCFCNHSDVYEPCPVVGFACGIGETGPRSCDCCTDEQWAATRPDLVDRTLTQEALTDG